MPTATKQRSPGGITGAAISPADRETLEAWATARGWALCWSGDEHYLALASLFTLPIEGAATFCLYLDPATGEFVADEPGRGEIARGLLPAFLDDLDEQGRLYLKWRWAGLRAAIGRRHEEPAAALGD